jgi:Ca2+:H+ antiporter
MKTTGSLPLWTIIVPVFSWLVFFVQHYIHWSPFFIISSVALIGAVLSAVFHAETIAHRVGEPFGTLVLALAVTLIEVSLIVSLMFAAGHDSSVLARDTVFAAVMIILNGMIGLSILAGGIRYREQSFVLQGISSALTILVAISVLTLILPNFTVSVPGPFYNKQQLIFVAIITLILYGTFILVQNIRHRDHFLTASEEEDEEIFVKPSGKIAIVSTVFLIVCLGAVVFLAESLAPGLESWVQSIGAPVSLVGVIIALVVLLPEGLSAYRAARKNHLQKSLNLSLGSALASIGLTIPTVSFVSLYTGLPLTLGINAGSSMLFLLSLIIIILSLSTGKTTILQGIVLLIIFAVYIFSIIFP